MLRKNHGPPLPACAEETTTRRGQEDGLLWNGGIPSNFQNGIAGEGFGKNKKIRSMFSEKPAGVEFTKS
jgi:hypothetical protein